MQLNKIERSSLDAEIEQLRDELNRQKNIKDRAALEISLQLDRLILKAMQQQEKVAAKK